MRPACLLLHGFCGSPFEVAPLAPGLQALGCAVSMPTLPGHGTNIQDMLATGYDDWLNCALAEFDRLSAAHASVAVLGFSLGGALALHLAALRQPIAVAALAPPARIWSFIPLQIPDWRLPLTAVIQRFQPILPTHPRSENAKRLAPWQGYEGVMPLGPLRSMGRGLARMRRALPRVSAPALLMASKKDRYAPPSGMLDLASRIASPSVTARIIEIPGSSAQHMLTTHTGCAEQVVEECVNFVSRVVGE